MAPLNAITPETFQIVVAGFFQGQIFRSKEGLNQFITLAQVALTKNGSTFLALKDADHGRFFSALAAAVRTNHQVNLP